jgi:glycine hydroxymethyltransferase
MVDLSPRGITGRDAEEALLAAGISVNRNAIPFDTQPPRITSGIRMGTPAVTSRGFGREQIGQVAAFIARVLSSSEDTEAQEQVRREATEMCRQFPIPGLTWSI